MLIAAQWQVALHKDRYKNRPDIADHEWAPVVAGEGFAIISSDKKMSSWLAEKGKVRPALNKAKAKVFFVRGQGLELDDQAVAIAAAKTQICRLCKQHAGTYLFARIHTVGSRLGEVQVLATGAVTKLEKKYGAQNEPA